MNSWALQKDEPSRSCSPFFFNLYLFHKFEFVSKAQFHRIYLFGQPFWSMAISSLPL
jgi:hypothetical protein